MIRPASPVAPAAGTRRSVEFALACRMILFEIYIPEHKLDYDIQGYS